MLYFVLIAGFALAALSLILRKDKTLGGAAMAVTMLATMIGSLPAHRDYRIEGIFFGLDFFILNVLFTGALFIPIERLFPQNPDQPVLRDEWREDLFYYLVSSLFIQVLTYLTLAPSNFVTQYQDLGAIRAFATPCRGSCSSSRSCCSPTSRSTGCTAPSTGCRRCGASTPCITPRSRWTGSPARACISWRSSSCAASPRRRCW